MGGFAEAGARPLPQWQAFACSSLAPALACLATNPLEVAKVRQQVSPPPPAPPRAPPAAAEVPPPPSLLASNRRRWEEPL